MSTDRICRKSIERFIRVANDKPFRQSLWYIVAGGAAVRIALLLWSIVDRDFLVVYRLPDDAMYYFGIAANVQHLLHAPLLSYDGVHPTNGMHPLWVFILAPLFSMGLAKWTAVLSALALQTALDCGVVWLVGRIVYDTLTTASEYNRRTISLVCAGLYAFNAVIVLRSINGLETTLTAFLLVLWFSLAVRMLQGARATAFGIVIGALVLARTDTVLLIAPALLWLIGHAETRPHAIRASIIAAVIVLPWFIWNLATFGTVLQSSGLAVPYFAMKKYDVLYSGFGKTWHLGIEAIRNVLKPWFFAGAFIPLMTVAVAWRRFKREPLIQLVTLAAIGSIILLIVHSLFRGFVREWYILMQIPLVVVLYGIAAGYWAEGRAIRAGGRLRFAILIVLIIVPFAIRPAYESQRLIVERGIPLIDSLSKTHRIAALNSGYYGYFASRPASVVNIDGVVNYEAYEAITAGRLEAYLIADSVDYVLDLAADLGGYKGLIDRRLLSDFQFDTTFTLPKQPEELVLYQRK